MGLAEQARASRSVVSMTRRRISLAVFLSALFTCLLTLWHHRPRSEGFEKFQFSLPAAPASVRLGKGNQLRDIYNSTLGFQKVYAINLPARSDKRDAILLQSQLTGFDVEIVDGVPGGDVHPKAIPYTYDQDVGSTGCWRAHLNVLHKIIEDKVETALILEDDADWDVAIKAQMAELARGSRFLLDTGNKVPHSPYGDGWKMLWLGHCHTEPKHDDYRRWVIPRDPTVAPAGFRWNFGAPEMSRWNEGSNPDPQARVVYVQEYGWCISGYAVTRQAAEMIIYKTSMIPFNAAIDGGMGNMCKDGSLDNFTCIATFPRLIGKSTPAGPQDRSSDIGTYEGEIQVDSKSENVMFSARQNLLRLINGETTYKSFFPNPSGDELTLEQITRFGGHAEYMDPPTPPEDGIKERK